MGQYAALLAALSQQGQGNQGATGFTQPGTGFPAQGQMQRPQMPAGAASTPQNGLASIGNNPQLMQLLMQHAQQNGQAGGQMPGGMTPGQMPQNAQAPQSGQMPQTGQMPQQSGMPQNNILQMISSNPQLMQMLMGKQQ